MFACAVLAACASTEQASNGVASPVSPALKPGPVLSQVPASPDQARASAPDWIDSVAGLRRRLIPRDGAHSLDNPPVLSWASHPERAPRSGYRLVVEGPQGVQLDVELASPRFLATAPWPTGRYTWRAGVTTARGMVWSRERRFVIDPAAAACALPEGTAALSALRSSAPPRMLPHGPAWEVARAQWRGTREHEYGLFVRGVQDAMRRQPEPARMDSVAQAAYEALAWRYSGKASLRESASRKLLAVSAWPADGETSEAADDQKNRAVYLSLARGFDLLHDTLAPAERFRLREAALKRVRQYVAAEIDSGVFDEWPYRSHAAASMSFALEALALLAAHAETGGAGGAGGVRDDADAMFVKVWDHYRTLYPVWGAQDGSDGNGMGYGWLNLLQPPQTWMVLRHATGIDWTCRAHMRRAGLQPVYFMPPARPASRGRVAGPVPPFGDGADIEGDYLFPATADRELRLYASLIGEPLYHWYSGQARELVRATQTEGFHTMGLGLLLAAPPEPAATVALPPATPDALAFEESGAVAMHSALGDPERTSVFFLSGRFGNWNHSRAEQNAFVVTMAGESVLASSGYYDFTPHGRQYTRRTLAANAITFDGGRGQAEDDGGASVESMDFRGRLVRWRTEAAPFFATGDASLAYRRAPRGQPFDQAIGSAVLQPLLQEALRSVVYLRDERVIVVFDRLRSAEPRRWEWNLHSLRPFEPLEGGTVRARGGEHALCIDLHGPAARFEQTNAFPIAPSTAVPSRPAQWHGRWTVESPSREATFVAVLRERCAARPHRVTFDASGGAAVLSLSAIAVMPEQRTWRLDGDLTLMPSAP